MAAASTVIAIASAKQAAREAESHPSVGNLSPSVGNLSPSVGNRSPLEAKLLGRLIWKLPHRDPTSFGDSADLQRDFPIIHSANSKSDWIVKAHCGHYIVAVRGRMYLFRQDCVIADMGALPSGNIAWGKKLLQSDLLRIAYSLEGF